MDYFRDEDSVIAGFNGLDDGALHGRKAPIEDRGA
jgi:hypothetical protein